MTSAWTSERLGTLLCLTAAAAFALQPVLVKTAFESGASVASVGAIRFALAAAVLALLARRALAAASPALLLPPFLLGLTLYGLETGLYFASLERIDASLASLLMCGYPALVLAGAVLLRRERASGRRVAALAVALGGVSLVLAGGVGGALDPLGVGLAVAAAVSYAAYVLVSDRLLGATEPLVLATMVCAGAAIAFALGGAATGSLDLRPAPSVLLLVAAVAVVATVLPIAAFLAGLRRLGPSRATIVGTVEPPLTIGLSAVVLGERLGPLQLLGAGLVLAAIVILQARRKQPVLRPVPQPRPRPIPDTEPLAA